MLQLDGDTSAKGGVEEAQDDERVHSSTVPTDLMPIPLAEAKISSVGDTQQASNDEPENSSSNVQTEAKPDVADESPPKIRQSCHKPKGITMISLVIFNFTELIYLFLLKCNCNNRADCTFDL